VPVKLRRLKIRNMKISDEAIEAFRTCETIVDAGLDDTFEDQGGRREEYLEAHLSLHRALGLKPWSASPADVPDRGECTYDGSASWSASWAAAQELRRELLAAMKAKSK
jgi:hypothetical protein